MVWFCNECGMEFSKWQGQCSGCKSWNTIVEEPKRDTTKSPNKSTIVTAKNYAKRLKEVESDDAKRVETGFKELDRVLGGGLVLGSVVLLGGDPGIGKSTLLMQICNKLANNGNVLYVTGEESSAQVKMRAERLKTTHEDVFLISENDLDIIEESIQEVNPKVIIVDSVQTIYRQSLGSGAGTVTQVRGVAETFTYIAKQTNCTCILVGHVTKDGALAGPRVLEHLVDTVLYFEGDRYDVFRILRTVKNRFGSTNEIGVFEMGEEGFKEVKNPSLLFVNNDNHSPGCVITCAMEGTRPVLAETQALVSVSSFSNPRRTATGFDYNKIIVISAILEKTAGINLSKYDIYLNVVGGFKLIERSADLAIAISIVSSLMNQSTIENFIAIGELSLTGDIRTIGSIEKRINECIRLGFKNIMLPFSSKKSVDDLNIDRNSVNLIFVKNVDEAIKFAFVQN